jgi:hypothetical protein
MSVEEDINVIRQVVRRHMLETKFQSASHEIDDQRPIQITVAIPSHDRDWRPSGAKLVENVLGANIPQMPDFIGTFRDLKHSFR